MQRPCTAKITSECHHLLRPNKIQPPPCDVFINHRGINTKRNVAGFLYHHLRAVGLRPFLDNKNMNPGDRLFDKINVGVRECEVGIAVFSPRYYDSYFCLHFCLHELGLMMECRKKVLPIFVDLKPVELRVKDNSSWPVEDLAKFRLALEEAKNTVGLAFDKRRGDWPEFLGKSTDGVIKNLWANPKIYSILQML